MNPIHVPSVGQRISVRWRSPEGLTDLVGGVSDVTRSDADVSVSVQPWDRGPRQVPWSQVLAARVVPDKAIRPSSSASDLARLTHLGWPGLEQERLGGWILRAGAGYSSRANSALVDGDPEVSWPQALTIVTSFYRDRNLVPTVQLSHYPAADHPLSAAFSRSGWSSDHHTVVMTRDLRQQAPVTGCLPKGWDVEWADAPSDTWLAAEPHPHQARVAVLTAAPAEYLTLRAPGNRDAVAVARIVTTYDWIGISGLWVDPNYRRQGIGAAVLALLADRGGGQGARFGYLQVLGTNHPARSVYSAQGWTVHSEYAYWTPEHV